MGHRAAKPPYFLRHSAIARPAPATRTTECCSPESARVWGPSEVDPAGSTLQASPTRLAPVPGSCSWFLCRLDGAAACSTPLSRGPCCLDTHRIAWSPGGCRQAVSRMSTTGRFGGRQRNDLGRRPDFCGKYRHGFPVHTGSPYPPGWADLDRSSATGRPSP